MDHLSPQQRSKNMAAIHSKNTKPEMIVRKVSSNTVPGTVLPVL
jgi:G:T-mismatch repair DNA endonuclease (very short patch repair protein)